MTLSGFLALAGLTGVIIYSQNVASLKGFEGDKGQCKIMAVYREESCSGHDRNERSGSSKEAAKGFYTFDYDAMVLSPEVCPNTTIRYDHKQGSMWCDKEPEHPLDEELACWYEPDCSKVWFEDPDSLAGRKIQWLVVSIVGLALCGLIHAAHWYVWADLEDVDDMREIHPRDCCIVLCPFLLYHCCESRTAGKDVEVCPPPPPHMDVKKPVAPPAETMLTHVAAPLNPNSNDGCKALPPAHDTEYPQPTPPPHLAGLESKNVSAQVGEMTPVSVPPDANKKWEEV